MVGDVEKERRSWFGLMLFDARRDLMSATSSSVRIWGRCGVDAGTM
jgi:hypothetical protein